MKTQFPPLLISLKPTYADLVFRGLKKAELRRRISKDLSNRDVYIYVSSPLKELRGGFRIGQVWEGSPDQIWSMVSNLAGVSREVFNQYYEGKSIAYALEILDVWEYSNPLSLEELRKQFNGFVVPQSYRYVKPKEQTAFQSLSIIQYTKPDICVV